MTVETWSNENGKVDVGESEREKEREGGRKDQQEAP